MRLKGISLEDAVESYRWLGHEVGVTEVVALSPYYRPGPENAAWNKRHRSYPVTRYVSDEVGIEKFLQEHRDGGRMVCMSLNPRPQAYQNSKGYPRAAREDEIAIARNVLFDLDLSEGKFSHEHQAEFEAFAKDANDYFCDLGVTAPARASTGKGYHLLFALPGIQATRHADVSSRIAKFAAEFRQDFHKELSALDLKLDSTHDLRRMVRIYGTAKPSVGIVSRFYGGLRKEDAGLEKYLLGLKLEDGDVAVRSSGPYYGACLIRVHDALPPVVASLIKGDEKLRGLWHIPIRLIPGSVQYAAPSNKRHSWVSSMS